MRFQGRPSSSCQTPLCPGPKGTEARLARSDPRAVDPKQWPWRDHRHAGNGVDPPSPRHQESGPEMSRRRELGPAADPDTKRSAKPFCPIAPAHMMAELDLVQWLRQAAVPIRK